MAHLVLELVLWMLVAFFVGCLLGWLTRSLFAGEQQTATAYAPGSYAIPAKSEPIPAPVMEAPPKPAALPEPSPAPSVAVDTPTILPVGKMERPRGIDAPREGKADDLQRISGIGPKNQKVLHNLGFYHFDQIAAWSERHVVWVDDHLKFNGRIVREEWVQQAILLAEGKEDEFRKLYGTGGMRDKTGEKKSGSRTRRK